MAYVLGVMGCFKLKIIALHETNAGLRPQPISPKFLSEKRYPTFESACIFRSSHNFYYFLMQDFEFKSLSTLSSDEPKTDV